jgi:hypothetical protein
MIKDYSNSVIYADKVLSNPKTDDNVKSDANILLVQQCKQETKQSEIRIH